MIVRSEHATASIVLPAGKPVLDWADLAVGDQVELVEDSGQLTAASVETLTPDGSIVWIAPKGTGHRRLWLRTDAVTIYRH
jgi:hypothetical protein